MTLIESEDDDKINDLFSSGGQRVGGREGRGARRGRGPGSGRGRGRGRGRGPGRRVPVTPSIRRDVVSSSTINDSSEHFTRKLSYITTPITSALDSTKEQTVTKPNNQSSTSTSQSSVPAFTESERQILVQMLDYSREREEALRKECIEREKSNMNFAERIVTLTMAGAGDIVSKMNKSSS